jgi:flagellar biosynthesis protein FlhB
MSDSTAERSLPPTPRRREAARRAGLLPTAAWPAWGASCLVTILLLPRWLEATGRAGAGFLQDALPAAVRSAHAGRGADTIAPWGAAALVVWPTVTLVVAALTAAMVVRVACDGLHWQPGRAAFDLRRLDPWSGLTRIFSTATLTTILGGALGLGVVAAVVAWAGRSLLHVWDTGALATPQGSLAVARGILVPVAVVAASVALADWALARRRAERRLWMTPEEFAAEQRSLEAGRRVRFDQPRHRGVSARGRAAAPLDEPATGGQTAGAR